MPAARVSRRNGLEITLDETLVAQRTQPAQLPLADAATGGREVPQHRLGGQPPVERDQFAQFITGGVRVGPQDRRPFEREENFPLISTEEGLERGEIMDGRILPHRRSRVERGQSVRRAELVEQRMRIAQQFRRLDGFNCRLARHLFVYRRPGSSSVTAAEFR